MTITPQPESLCLTGNMASIRVTTDTDITMTLTSGNDELLTHTYSPTADNIVDINLRDIVLSLLSFDLKNQSTPYQQTMICRSFTVTLTDGTDTETVSFKALRAGVDNLSDTVGNFLQHNFLTWQPNVKPVTYYTPEFLTYYAQQQVVVKCLAHIAEGNETTVTLATISADTCVTIPVQYAIIAGLTNALPQWYDVWVETGGGTRLTYKQRYYAQDMRSEQEQWILFENSLGGIDTFRAYGDSDNTAEHTHNVAEIEEVSQEYRVDTERKYKKSTGRLDRNERLWLLDFFPSTRKYIYIGQSLRQIVVVESDVNYKASELPSSYTFTYRYADAKPYLNLPRTDVPLEVLDIQVPDVGSFTVAPRLVEFPATPLSDGALFPVQDPYSEEWGTTTFGAIRQIIAAMVSTAEESFAVLTHTHLNKSFLDGLSWDSIRNHFAGYFLSKTNADTANGVITFVSGLVSNAIAWFKQGIKIGSSADSTMGIDANGNAKLNNVTAAQLIASVLKTPGFAEAVGLAGKGFGVTAGQDGRATLQTDDLIVLGRMLVNSLNVREVTYIGGVYLLTPAGSTVAAVQQLYAESGSESDTRAWSTDSSGMTDPVVVGYRLYWLADNGTTATMNFWQQGDQAYCQTFNIEAGVHENVSNSLWWRLVVGVGTDDSDPLGDGKDYHYADVADTDIVLLFDSEGEPVTGDGGSLSFIGKGSSYAFVQNGLNSYTAPVVGDKAVCLGSQTSSNRRGAIQLNTEGVASIGIYDGINNYAPLSTHEVHFFSKDAVRMSSRRFSWTTATGASTPPVIYRGDWTQGSISYYYDEWDYQGSRWLCLYQGAEGITCAPGTVPQGDTTHSWTYYWKKISLKGDSVKIAGYAEYYYGDSSRPKPASPSVDGDIALLDYPDNSNDMIDVGVIDDMETLSGYWDGQSVPYGTCYIYRPNKHLYEATESGWRDLGKFVGDDGNGILSITRTYGISAQSTTASETTAPSDISSWASNSPAVTEAKPFLWAKEVVVYTKASTTTKYYCIGARGDNGIDAKDAEWAYIRTKTNVPPVIDSDSSYTDSNGKTYTVDDHLPKVVPGTGGLANDIEDDNSGNPAKKYECTDDPQGVTSEWKYEWEIKREKGNADSSGHRAWSAYSGEMTIHTMWAASPIIADLDNEMDGVACDVGGDSDHSQTCTTTASLLQGSTKKSFTLKIREWDEDDQEYNEITQSGSTLTDVVVNWTDNSDNSKTITFTFGEGVTVNDKREFIVVMIADNMEYKAVFTVNGVLPGANGEPATIYNILPSLDKITFARDANGGLTPPSRLLSFMVRKAVGGNITDILSGQMYSSDKLRLTYSVSEPPSSYNSNQLWPVSSAKEDTDANISFNAYGTATIPNSVAFSSLYLALFKEITNGNSTSYTLLDRETIPVIKDGANGTDGEDGEPGADAWTLTVNPSPIIIEQDIETPSSFGLPINISFIAKCGDNTATVGTIGSGDVSNNLGLTISRVTTGTDYNNGVRLQITGYNKNSQTGRYATNGYITCTIPLSYGSGTTARSTSMDVRIQVGVNLLGEWETKIVGDAETSVATKLTNAVIDGEINTFQQVGTYIRSASENTAKLTETIGARSNGNNLFGFSKGVRFGTFIPFVQGYGIVSNTSADTQLHQAWVNNLGFDGKTGYYVVTCEAKMLGGSSKDVTFSLYGTETNDNPSSVTKTVGTTWTKLTMVFYIASFADSEASRNGQFHINNIPDTNRIAIRKLQIEHGSVPSDFGVCKEDEMAASVPVSIDWSVPSAFTKASSGGPDGGECYYNNTHPASGSSIEINAFNISLPYGVYTMSFWAKANVDEYTIQCICCDVNNYDTNVMPDLISGEYGVMESYQESGMNKYGSVNIKLSTQWRKYYVPYYLASAGNMYIVPMRINYGYTGGSSGTFYISKIKFEKGYVTSSNRTEYQTVMKQTAHNIDFSVLVNSMEKAGIHLYTSNKTTPESEDEIDEGIIDIVAGKVRFVDPNGNPYASPKVAINPTTGVFETVDARLSGNLYTPYKRLTSSNISSYRLTNFAGETVVNLSSTGLNLQVEVAVELRLPEITADMLGCEVNIFNATTSMLTITGSGNTTSSSSDKYCANLIIPSTASNLGTNGSVGLQKYREAKFKAVYTGYSSIQQYAWLCCFANINP